MSDSITIIDENKVIDVVLIAGRILLEAGAETYRVEDTMNRIAHSYGLHDTYSFVTSTAIIFSLNDRTSTRLIRIRERTTDLEKIALTNSLSRKISSNQLTIDEAKNELLHLKRASLQYSFLMNLLAAFIACGFFLFMFGGVASDAWIACIAGGAAFLTFSFVQKYIQIKFFSEFVASAVVISIAAIFIKLGIAKNQDIITIASVMPLVPGILITNAIRDLLAGELLAGMSRGVEAALTAFAIGAGVAIVLLLL
ncbi:threonine/serine exporter family protein [Staphylococcus saccharolyticus]|uniref:Integral membrane protein n=1 Tax=Staphylococcus saccharolyticus TaxID=33028 RepID=A0A380H951_9STAP|nr:threonine/serine exporter ThrE family protein [Staphylococcus saccharolyticus]MBL7565740.1 threonine/serine exporter ThrE family protein [Staphylococcus saccharolyticus]MBL7572178.1 threonine/serine exporter ThrE family protein [Staphylococcus saccharolyticus]QQB97732.1 threonine/serine exporter ThrE family protein [Staphylococcus saccharolyticus]QRJ66412.1 threonine/serine exporter ThrE family protein [Staphylococcus saccharolyticus]RTX96118.1 threonine/serine exporter ThrE family protein 